MTGDVGRLLAELDLDLELLRELEALRARVSELQDRVDDLAWELVLTEEENRHLLVALAHPGSGGDDADLG